MSESQIVFAITTTPDDAELRAVDDGISAYNDAEPELAKVRNLAASVRLPVGLGVGGAVSCTWERCCELQQLWVAADLRPQ